MSTFTLNRILNEKLKQNLNTLKMIERNAQTSAATGRHSFVNQYNKKKTRLIASPEDRPQKQLTIDKIIYTADTLRDC